MSSLSALMEFLRLLCENHYLEMQDYMRKQPDNLRSYNVVRERKGAACLAWLWKQRELGKAGPVCFPARRSIEACTDTGRALMCWERLYLHLPTGGHGRVFQGLPTFTTATVAAAAAPAAAAAYF